MASDQLDTTLRNAYLRAYGCSCAMAIARAGGWREPWTTERIQAVREAELRKLRRGDEYAARAKSDPDSFSTRSVLAMRRGLQEKADLATELLRTRRALANVLRWHGNYNKVREVASIVWAYRLLGCGASDDAMDAIIAAGEVDDGD